MRQRKYRVFVGDFETTTYSNQNHTEVWASALVEINRNDVEILHSIEQTLDYLVNLQCNVIVYYHNLKFDGNFWLAYFMVKCGFKQAIRAKHNEKNELTYEWLNEKDMPRWSFKYSISDRGQWYTITLKTDKHIIEFRDSFKLLPFSVKRIGESFATEHKKLDMEYKGFRYAGCEITEKEKKYIRNDVLVIKEALEIAFSEGHTKLTIGSCCLDEFKKGYDKDLYETLFPNLHQVQIDKQKYIYENAGKYIRKSYRGGWCYVAKGYENKVITTGGITIDVNSLYPSMMHSESGNYYPIGLPTFWTGNYIPECVKYKHRYYFVKIRCRFKLRKRFLPFIQIKDNFLYKGNECLETSDIYDLKTATYKEYYINPNGEKIPATVELTLTMTDYKLFLEHYETKELEILSGCWFETEIGLFDRYINKYKKIKQNSEGAYRELAKLFLNNLYGKFAASTDSSFKMAILKENGVIGFVPVHKEDKQPGYIAIGSAITSYARNFTIRAAQANYKYFRYSDTDSLHLTTTIEKVKGVTIHGSNFCCWDYETHWTQAIFTRQKTYIEYVDSKGYKKLDTPYYNVKCAGMTDKCKDLFIKSITDFFNSEDTESVEKWKEKATQEEIEFVSKKRKLSDFCVGLIVPGRLMPKRYKGGIVLLEQNYEMR